MSIPLPDIRQVVTHVLGDLAPGSAGALSKLIDMEPSRVDNPVGQAVLKALVARAKSRLPGESSGMKIYFGLTVLMKKGSYRELFYPAYQLDRNEDVIASTVAGASLDASLWIPCATAVLTQAISRVGKRTATSIQQDEVARDLGQLNAVILANLWHWYAVILRREVPELDTLAASISKDGAVVAERYAKVLRSDPWIAMINEMIRSGQLRDIAWTFFHHWIKLWSLSRDNDLVAAVIGHLGEKLITLPDSVRGSQWQGYRVWLPVPALDYQQFLEAEPRILEPIGYAMDGHIQQLDEGYAAHFVEEGPGKKYRFTAPAAAGCAFASLTPRLAAAAPGYAAASALAGEAGEEGPSFSVERQLDALRQIRADLKAAGEMGEWYVETYNRLSEPIIRLYERDGDLRDLLLVRRWDEYASDRQGLTAAEVYFELLDLFRPGVSGGALQIPEGYLRIISDLMDLVIDLCAKPAHGNQLVMLSKGMSALNDLITRGYFEEYAAAGTYAAIQARIRAQAAPAPWWTD